MLDTRRAAPVAQVKAVEGRSNMTVLLIQALENYRRERE